MQHTPGPWAWSESGHTLHPVTPNPNTSSIHTIISSDGGECGYLGSSVRKTVDELDADKLLIAAAPDLISVLCELQESASYWSEYDVPLGIVDRINAAIKRATGVAA